MKSLILVSKKPVVIQIFTLVCKQLHIQLEVLHEAQIDHKVDIIVIDKEFISDRFNILKSYCKRIGAISKEEISSFDVANDFRIPVPFIPSQLYEMLDQQINILNKRANSKVYVSNIEVPDQEVQGLEDYYQEETANDQFVVDNEVDSKETSVDDTKIAVDYLESLADEIVTNVDEEEDDSVVTINSINNGGVLDNGELSKLEEIVNETTKKVEMSEMEALLNETESNEDEWQDLSSIIDQAIDEVSTVDHVRESISESGPLKVLINNYELEQLKPLLNLLDQNSIDMLSDGEEIDLILKLDNGK